MCVIKFIMLSEVKAKSLFSCFNILRKYVGIV